MSYSVKPITYRGANIWAVIDDAGTIQCMCASFTGALDVSETLTLGQTQRMDMAALAPCNDV